MSDITPWTSFDPSRKSLFRMIIPSYPSFNVYSSVARHTTALGPILVATIVSKMNGWEVEVIDENNYRSRGPRGDDGRPDHEELQKIRRADVVGFYGGLTSTVPRLYQLARFYRSQGAPTLAGGQHFVGDNIREALNNGVDYVIFGEGEKTIEELLNALAGKRDPATIGGLAFLQRGELVETPRRETIEELEKLPLPDFSLLHYARVSLFPVGWSRGCCMRCEFCTVKDKVRCPNADYVFDQIATLFEKRNAKSFFIVDDLFGQKREEALRLCRRLTEYQEKMGVHFFITVQIRLDKAKDLELLKAMRLANVRVTAIGYETPIPEELEAMNKKLNPDDMIAMTRVFHQVGFLVHGMFIFGYPSKNANPPIISTRERVKRFNAFIKKSRVDTVQVLLTVPLPGTELTERLQSQGRIFPRDLVGWEYYDGNFPLFTPDPPMTAEEARLAIKAIMGRFYKFRYLFSIGFNVLLFPTILFPFFNIKSGWKRWYKSWRNDIWRFIGWSILRKWSYHFKKDSFSEKLQRAMDMFKTKERHS